MISDIRTEGRELVAHARSAASAHNTTWEALVPTNLEVNFDVEDAEEAAFSVMAGAKAKLRDHICQTYGISIQELVSLAMP